MQKLIKKLETTAISMETMRNAAPPGCKVVLYDKLQRWPGGNSVIVLYQLHDAAGRATDQIGHYAVILKTANSKKMRYFSSYAYPPEFELRATHSKGRMLALLGKHYTWSRAPLQRKRHTTTCGLWALCRAYFWGMRDNDFAKMMTGRVRLSSPDDLVSTMMLSLVAKEL